MKEKKTSFIKDPIHGEINFFSQDLWLKEIIFSPEFQRLNRIRQLGLSYLIFPSATHTRFSHSLGTYETTRKFIDNLSIKNLNLKKRKTILAAALLHDIGHGPNSHAFEKYTNISHETYTKEIILDPQTDINKILIKNKVNPKDIVEIFEKKNKNEWMNNLVSSQIDADRIDYLQRDSHYTGATYGEIDAAIIAKRAIFIDGQIVFSIKAISAIENFLIGRYHMYEQVYENPHTIINEWIIQKILSRVKELYQKKFKFCDSNNLLNLIKPWLENKIFSIKEFLKLDDWNFSCFLDSLKNENDSILKELLNARDMKKNYNCLPFNKSNYEKALKKGNNLKSDIKYFLDIIEQKPVCLYDMNKQPIKICDQQNNKINDFYSLTNLINKYKTNNKIKKYLIISNKLL